MDKSELSITAGLAFLDLADDEYKTLGEEVKKILDYFSKMMEIDVSDLRPTTHALLEKNRLRSDTEGPGGSADALLENAPELEDRFIVIPNVL
jgi:aspartyl-tRNA(Asn)/glutamyl-tRNA(Gln) amidotransferase subunit C